MATRVQVVFDCADPDRMARFWSQALGYEIPGPPEGFDSWEAWLASMGVPEEDWNSASAVEDPDGVGPRIYFQRVPEGKSVKNRLHLDVNVGGGRGTQIEERKATIDQEATRLEGLGATRGRPLEGRGEYCLLMFDPEGNEFDLQ